ncbi:MAG: putative lipid II flippase FtsW [Chlamydiae bacterium]|nr:putative lipid II flippase FtsW [Chlamydiota bacterium]
MTKPFFLLLICVFIVFSLGLLMIFNTTSAEVLDRSLEISTHLALIKQGIYAIIGIVIGLFFWYIGYQSIIEKSPLILLCSIFLLVLVFIPHVGQEINGAKRWLGFLGMTVQPSEIVKYVIPIYFIYRLDKCSDLNFNDFFKILVVCSLPIGLILLEPDTGTTVIILSSLVILFVLAKIRALWWLAPLLSLSLIGGVVAFNMPHVKDRIKIYLHPELDLKGKGHQPYQAKIAAGSGGLLGRGVGESLQKLDYLPEARNDYIAAIFAEEFGFVGICFLIGLYLTIGYVGFYIASKAKDKKGFYLGAIISFLITFQAFLNLGVVSALLPSKGTTLPFFSQGGSSLVINIIAIVLLLNIAKQSQKVEERYA